MTTDGNGEAGLTSSPTYLVTSARDFKYTLTVVDDSDSTTFVMAKVARKIRDNRFQRLHERTRSIEVSWRVDALRNDRWVQRNGAPTVVEKSGREERDLSEPRLVRFARQPGSQPCAHLTPVRSSASKVAPSLPLAPLGRGGWGVRGRPGKNRNEFSRMPQWLGRC